MEFFRSLCRTVGHIPNERRAWFDKVNYRSRCKRCGIEMVRELDVWREFVPNETSDPEPQLSDER
jgi:hypothetical protein